MKKTKRILIVTGGIWIPAINMAGTKAIFNHIKTISSNKSIKIDVLTSIPNWASDSNDEWFEKIRNEYGVRILSIDEPKRNYSSTINLLVVRLLMLFKTYKLCKKNHYDIIHDYVSSPVLFLFSYIYAYVCKAKVIITLCTYKSGGCGYFDKMYCRSPIESIVFLSKSIMKCYDDNYVSFDKKFIPLGIDLNRQVSLNESSAIDNADKGKKIILYVGPLEKRKGVFAFAEAARLLNEKHINNDYIFLIISYGKTALDTNHENAKERVQSIIGNNLRVLTGQQNVLFYMSICNVFVYPMERMDGTLAQPHTMIEAIMSNIPIVYSSLEELDVFSDYSKSYRFEASRYDKLANKIKQASDECCDSKYKDNSIARESVLDDYDIVKQGKKITDLYQQVI